MTALARFRASMRAWNDYHRFRLLDPQRTPLVVYSEGSGDWPHLGPILTQLLERGTGFAYCTSDQHDPGLLLRDPRVSVFYVGMGTIRTVFFRELVCQVLLTTLPDLDVFALKRSPRVGTYVYAFHSINSIHTVYRPRAFEKYDVLLCVGPHHVEELRREEELKGLPPRRLLEHGSVKLDAVASGHEQLSEEVSPGHATRLALVAPSWGEGSIAEDRDLLDRVILGVCAASWNCRLRLHPMTVRRLPGLAGDLRRRHAGLRELGRFEVETDMNDDDAFRDACVMISDWSGAATEFAFARGRPVLFIDTPRKIHNPGWREFGLPGLEERIRSEIGIVVAPSMVSSIGSALRALDEDAPSHARRIAEVRRRWIFNVGCAAEAGAEHLNSLLAEGKAGGGDYPGAC